MTKTSVEKVFSTNPLDLPITPAEAGFCDPDLLPWVSMGERVQFKVLSCCNVTGRYALISKYLPGTQIPTHRHSGRVTAITLQGSWQYLEHDFHAKPGCIAFETANSNHTLKVDEDIDEEMILLGIIEGNIISYADDGTILTIDDSQTHTLRYLTLAKEQGHDIDPELIFRNG